MSFKIKSTVSVNEYPTEGSKTGGIEHIVLSRERPLHQGEKITVSGSITFDNEAKGGWMNAKGEIRIIDERTLGIRWKPSLGETLFYTAVGGPEGGIRPTIPEAIEYAKWEEEQIVPAGENGKPIEFGDAYHSRPKIPELFTLIDKARIGPLTEKMLHRVEGPKHIERKTELIYES